MCVQGEEEEHGSRGVTGGLPVIRGREIHSNRIRTLG